MPSGLRFLREGHGLVLREHTQLSFLERSGWKGVRLKPADICRIFEQWSKTLVICYILYIFSVYIYIYIYIYIYLYFYIYIYLYIYIFIFIYIYIYIYFYIYIYIYFYIYIFIFIYNYIFGIILPRYTGLWEAITRMPINQPVYVTRVLITAHLIFFNRFHRVVGKMMASWNDTPFIINPTTTPYITWVSIDIYRVQAPFKGLLGRLNG